MTQTNQGDQKDTRPVRITVDVTVTPQTEQLERWVRRNLERIVGVSVYTVEIEE